MGVPTKFVPPGGSKAGQLKKRRLDMQVLRPARFRPHEALENIPKDGFGQLFFIF